MSRCVFDVFSPALALPRRAGGGPLAQQAAELLSSGESTVLVEVTDAKGSVPRAAGTRMLVTASQAMGTIGGGHLELKAIALARAMLASGDAGAQQRHYPLGPALGQCCGGAVTLGFERLRPQHLAAWPAAAPRFHLQLYGAGHVGRAIARLLATLDVSVDWIDEREDEFPASLIDGGWPAHVRRVAVDAVESEVRSAPAGAFYLVLTHRHDLDLRITETVLRRGDFGFMGLIGSRTKRLRFVHRFEQLGIDPELIARMTCPIGLPDIAGKEPEVIALAVLAQLLALAPPRDPAPSLN
jgi:xanthine dehydrogenase accessory factor